MASRAPSSSSGSVTRTAAEPRVRPDSELVATWLRPGCDPAATPVRPSRDLAAARLRPGCDPDRSRRRYFEAWIIPRQNGLGADAAFREARGSDHAHPHPVPRPVTAEAVRVAPPLQLERRALDVLPPERSSDRHAQVLTGNLRRPQAVDAQPRDAARPR